MRHYTGIGSRSMPPEMNLELAHLAFHLELEGYILRSGGADGADQAFESGVVNPNNKDIMVPKDSIREAEEIASRIHPAWGQCNWIARACHGRNVMQLLGRDLKTPSEFVVAWTPGAKEIGGSRTVLVLAAQHNIPVFNMARDGDEVKLLRWLLFKLYGETTL